ncbi:sensor histidine kinase [Promicromonospora sp. NPDC057488]|uniref:sensor histidine kinase n=1 Tax=Promicromonospora sp. NPDC057488 TaxID=3346147 RepID=UPI00366D7B4F
MSIEAVLREEYDRAERRETVVITALPYVLLAAGTLITLLQPVAPVPLPIVLGVTAATAGWVTWFGPLHPQWHGSRGAMALYFSGLTVLAAVLVTFSPYYGIFAFIGYVHAVLVLRGVPRYVGVAATSMVMALAYMGGPASISADEEWWLWGAISLVSTGLAGVFIYSADATYSLGRRQKYALAELHEANARLQAALDENAELHARLMVQARAAGVQDERQRVAREIHDTLAQSLAGILAQLQAADQALDGRAPARRHVLSAMGLSRDGLVEARRTVHAVRPQVLAEARLPEALDDITARWALENTADATLTTTGDARPLHAEIEAALLRTAQESLANVAKHARATRVVLTLSYMEDLVTLDVRDDGVGFRPHEVGDHVSDGGGFGLAGMRQRVQRLAGRLVVESEPGGGTALSASLPAIPSAEGTT